MAAGFPLAAGAAPDEPDAADVVGAADDAALADAAAAVPDEAPEEEAFALAELAALDDVVFEVGFGVAACASAPTETATDSRKARPVAP